MKPVGKPYNLGTPELLVATRFERLVIFYKDAEDLRHGFQIWLRWHGRGELGCDWVPIYMGSAPAHAST